MYNVVQVYKIMFLFRQDDGTSTENNVRDFKYWGTCEAYKAAPANHLKIIKTRRDYIAGRPVAPLEDEKDHAELEIAREEFMGGIIG